MVKFSDQFGGLKGMQVTSKTHHAFLHRGESPPENIKICSTLECSGVSSGPQHKQVKQLCWLLAEQKYIFSSNQSDSSVLHSRWSSLCVAAGTAEEGLAGSGNPHWGAKSWGQKETCTGICNGTAESHNAYPDLPKSSEVTPIVQSCKVQQTLTNDAVGWSLRRSSCCLSHAWLASSAGHGMVARSCCQQCR